MAKKIEKSTHSLKLFDSVMEIFENFHNRTMGGKGEKVSAGIMAFMALYEIDENLATSLVDPNLTVKKASEMIRKNLANVIYRQSLEALTPEQRAQLLHDAELSQQRVLGKKKGKKGKK